MIRFETVSLGVGGVSPCVRCGTREAEPATADQVLSLLTAAASRGADGAVLSGIEPFAHPSLVEIIGAAHALGIPRIGVQTDGAALGAAQNAAGSVGAGVRFFEFAFLGGDAELHDRLAGRSGAFSSLVSGINAVKRLSSPERRIFVAGAVRICPHNIDQFVDMVAVAVGAGVRAVRVDLAPGATLSREAVDRAHAIATTAGVALFGAGCDHLLHGACLYELSPSSVDGEVSRG